MYYAEVILALMVGGSILTFSRRFKNFDKEAGTGVAGWTMVLIVLIVIKFLFPHFELPVK